MDKKTTQPEFWQQGPVNEIIPLLQPVVHALLQAREEVTAIMKDFPDNLLWQRPASLASVAFHLQHMTGVLDRLFTYARDKMLSQEQLLFLENEGKTDSTINSEALVHHFNAQVDTAVIQLKNTEERSLLEPRAIGRKRIPTNVLGLLFHAAEHIQRHTGQLIVTARVVSANAGQ